MSKFEGIIRNAIFTCLVIILLSSILPYASAASGLTIVSISGSETVTIGTWELAWPLNDYRIEFYAIPSFDGSNTMSWSTDRDLISPSEALSLTVNLEKGRHSYRMDFRAILIKKSTGETIFDKAAGTDLGLMDVPGSWSSPSVAVPVIPFEVIGIPVELSLHFRFSLTTQYSIAFSTYGLEPRTTTSEFTSSASKTVSFSKPSSVGAEVRLVNSAVKAQGDITVSAGLSVTGIPTPFKIDFATVPIGEWVTSSFQDVNMALLKTPVEIDLSLSSMLVNLGESVTVSGWVTPPSKGVTVQVVIEGTVVGTTQTLGDGSFTFNWEPPYASTFSVLTKSPETKYTTVAISPSIQLVVNRPPQASFTFSLISPEAGEKVQFSDESTDLDGQIVTRLWEFGDRATSAEKSPSHKYATEGTYTVRLTVKDNHGAEATSAQTITVKPASILPRAREGGLPEGVWWWVIVAVVIIVIIAVALLFRRR